MNEQVNMLFIDDNLYWIMAVRAQKTTEKIQLEACRTVADAFEKYKNLANNGLLFDCVLLDIIMPEENGGL